MKNGGPRLPGLPTIGRRAWISVGRLRNDKTGEFRGVAGPRGFASYREAVEASRFLGIDLLLVR